MTGEHRVQLRIPADHPSLAGHFPGQPVVPGVLLLERVLEALETWTAESFTRLPQAKFLAPLQPDTTAVVILRREPGRVRFRIEQQGRVLAQGTFAA